MAGIFARLSGLEKLTERFPAPQKPPEAALDKQTIQIGMVRFRNCVRVKICPTGLYLHVKMVFGNHPPVLIPWQELKNPQPAKIYQRKAKLLSVGSPPFTTIRLPQQLFDLAFPHLSPDEAV